MNKTKIPYLDYCWNVIKGCSKISMGCVNCWSEKMAKRQAGMKSKGYDTSNPFKPTFCHWKLKEPLQIKKPSVIGVSFMGDLFHDDISDEQLLSIFSIMESCVYQKFIKQLPWQ